MKNDTRHILNELFVELFNYILLIEEKSLQEHGVALSMNEVHVLESIQKSDVDVMNAIAKKLNITQGTLTITIQRLMKKGYVERIQDEKDRRIFHLQLTSKAKEVLKIHEAIHEELIDGVLDAIEIDHDDLMQSVKNVHAFFKKEK